MNAEYYDESNDDEYYGEEDEQIAKQELDHQHANQTSGCNIYSFGMKFIIASILIGGPCAAAGYFFGRYGNYSQSTGHVSCDQYTRTTTSTTTTIPYSNSDTEKFLKISIQEVDDSTLLINPKKCVVYRIKTNIQGKVRLHIFSIFLHFVST